MPVNLPVFQQATAPSTSTTSAATTTSVATTTSLNTTTTIAAPALFNTTFTQSGLPAGAVFQVTLNGTQKNSTPTSVTFTTANGIYNFTVANALYNGVALTPSPISGAVAAGATKSITFAAQTTFTENGLPLNIVWSVTYANQTASALTPANISFSTGYGTYRAGIQQLAVGGFNYTPQYPTGVLSGSRTTITFTASPAAPNSTSTTTSSTMPFSNATADTVISYYNTESVSDLTSQQLSSVNALNVTQLNSALSTARGVNTTVNGSVIYVDYGNLTQRSKPVKAGQQLYYLSKKGKRSIEVHQVAVRKAVPKLSIKVAGVTVDQPGQTYVIHYPIVKGRGSYTVSPSIFSSLAANNTAQFTFTAQVGGEVVATGALNSTSISRAFSYTIPSNRSFSLTFETNGNANYTAVDPNVIIYPTGIVNYFSITLTNPSATATPAPFDANFLIDSTDNTVYETTSVNNIEFFDAGYNVLTSWLEGNILNENQNALTNLNSVLQNKYWVQLPNGIPGSGSVTIYIGFAGNFVGDSGSLAQNMLMDCVNTGEAPQISVPYGSCDTGANVFTTYWNFQGSTLPSGWDRQALAVNVLVSNGLRFSGNLAVVNSLPMAINQITEAKIWPAIGVPKSELPANTAGMMVAADFPGGGTSANAVTKFGLSLPTAGRSAGQMFNGIWLSLASAVNSISASNGVQ
ncbi:MAG: hypothetical protein KGH58_04515, partial [Candidatus Micrarchaeota archaeon]|nr:hypothetical protein [Candidatus Micrarchaeota archaeon]